MRTTPNIPQKWGFPAGWCYRFDMTITVELPSDIATHENAGREALEALVIVGYKSEKLSHHEAARLLGMGRIEFEGFLKQRNVLEHAYGTDELMRDIETGNKLRASGQLPG